jgi:8-oxo-dGTP pyrophosphatase MutT (NUDIX family)
MARRTVFKGQIFSIEHEERVHPDGASVVYETVCAPDVVRVYPLLDGRLWLIQEFRPELDHEILRTVSGRIEPGESPEHAAARELREEIGGTVERLKLFATSRPILKVRSQVYHVLVKMRAMVAATPEAGEQIRPFPCLVSELEPMVWDGRIVEDVIALQLLRLVRDPGLIAQFRTLPDDAGQSARQS